MNDDFEHTLRDSLQRHAESGGPASGQLGDVYGRVDRRRARRRSIAVAGSIAIVGAGVIGIAALASSDPDAAPGAADGIGGDLPTTTFGAGASAWACTGYLGSDGVNELYSACVPTAFDDGTSGVCISTTTSTVPATSVVDGSTGVVVTSPPADCPAGAGSPYGPCVVPTSTVVLQPLTTPAGTGTMPVVTNPPVYDCPAGIVPTTAPVAIDTAPPTTPASPGFVDCRADTDAGATTTTSSSTTNVVNGTSPEPQSYVVVAGDSLFGIAAIYGVDPAIIANFNSWPDCLAHPLLVGDIVQIPPGALAPG